MSANLKIALSAAVPLHILTMQDAGGPTPEQYADAMAMAEKLGSRGDVLLFGGGKKGEAADLFNGLARALAVLSFVPGGIRAFGEHWETK